MWCTISLKPSREESQNGGFTDERTRNKGIEVCSLPEFWKINQELQEDHLGVDGEGRRDEKAEGAILQKMW